MAALGFESGLSPGNPRPEGCGRRVSLKRRSSTESEASRKTILVGIMRRDRLQESGQMVQLRALAHVDHQSGAADLAGLHGQVGELRDEFDRKIIDAVVAKVLERFRAPRPFPSRSCP